MKRFLGNTARLIIVWVVAVHLAVVLTLWIVPWLRRLIQPRPPQIIPVELTLAAVTPPEPAPLADPLPAPLKPSPATVATNAAPQPVRERPRIEVSQERVERIREPAPTLQPILTQDQLRDLLRDQLPTDPVAGAPAPADAGDLELIRQTLYQVWQQPSGHHLRGRVTEVSLRLDAQGRIQEHRLLRSSGDEAMDASVRKVMETVRRIPGISPGFSARRPWVTIYFELAD